MSNILDHLAGISIGRAIAEDWVHPSDRSGAAQVINEEISKAVKAERERCLAICDRVLNNPPQGHSKTLRSWAHIEAVKQISEGIRNGEPIK